MKSIYSIVATNYCGPKAAEVLKALKPGDAVTLVREPENKFDKNAVAVYVGAEKVGYIPKGKNVALAALIDQTGAEVTPHQKKVRLTGVIHIAADSATSEISVTRNKAIDAVFVPSPNSAFPQVQVG